MKIDNFLNEKAFFINLEFKNKNEALEYFSSQLVKQGFGEDESKILLAAIKRGKKNSRQE